MITVSPVASLVKLISHVLSSFTAFIKSSVILIEIFALVTLSRSVLQPINSSKSGCSHDKDNINAPLRLAWPINPVTKEYRSINETEPVVYLAELDTFAPRGAN